MGTPGKASEVTGMALVLSQAWAKPCLPRTWTFPLRNLVFFFSHLVGVWGSAELGVVRPVSGLLHNSATCSGCGLHGWKRRWENS